MTVTSPKDERFAAAIRGYREARQLAEAEAAQDAYAQAALAYDAASVALEWAREDRDEEGGADRLSRAHDAARRAYAVLETAHDTFRQLPDAQRAMVGRRDPKAADGTIIAPSRLDAAGIGDAAANWTPETARQRRGGTFGT